MGLTVSTLIYESNDFKISAGVDKSTNESVKFPIYEKLSDVKENADIVIDFSNHKAVKSLLEDAALKNLPVVIATTGFDENEKNIIYKTSDIIPIFMSANMSVGVNLIIQLVSEAAKVLEGYDIEIIEKHHNQKIDSPSGTALMIANAIKGASSNDYNFVYGRNPQSGKRKPGEIGIHSVRGGTIVGEHDVIFAGNDEIVEINHTALSRKIFAQGALKAAQFLYGKKPGLYSMSDLLMKG